MEKLVHSRIEEAAVDMKKFRNRVGLQRNLRSAKPHAASSQQPAATPTQDASPILQDQEGSGLHSTVFTCTDEELNPSLLRIIQ